MADEIADETELDAIELRIGAWLANELAINPFVAAVERGEVRARVADDEGRKLDALGVFERGIEGRAGERTAGGDAERGDAAGVAVE